jgi:SAM-dependent methyltransferase
MKIPGGPMRLDLGCGPAAAEGFEGVDIAPGPGVDHLVNLEAFPWPFDDDSVEAARSSHLVEHVRDLVGFMRELHRVMRAGARVEIQHPYQFNVRAWQDPTHVRCLNEVSWFYFDKPWRGGAEENSRGIGDWGGYGDTDFFLVELDALPMPEWQKVSDDDPAEFEKASRSLINVIADLRVVLECRKGTP